MKKLLFVLASALLFSGCIRTMDPYEGGDGIRANINGAKYTLLGVIGSKSYASTGNSTLYWFTIDAPMVNSLLDAEEGLKFHLNITDSAPFVTGKDYPVTGNEATVTPPGEDPAASSVTGWIRFLTFDTAKGTVEARFELTGDTYSLRHGYLRLPMHIGN